MSVVVLGNVAPLRVWKPDPNKTEVKSEPLEIDNGRKDNNTHTTVVIPPGRALDEALAEIKGPWYTHHSGERPAWVESDDPALAEAVARSFPDEQGNPVPIGAPKGWPEKGAKK